MALSPRLITIIGGLLGGGCGLAPLLSWKGSNDTSIAKPIDIKAPTTPSPTELSVNLPDPNQQTVTPLEEKKENLGNCTARKPLPTFEDLTWELDLREESYLAVSCQGTSLISEDENELSGDWTSLFPRELLNRGWILGEGEKLNMTTTIKKTGEDNYQIVFDGDGIKTPPITGVWEDISEKITIENIKAINTTSSDKKIYIRFK